VSKTPGEKIQVKYEPAPVRNFYRDDSANFKLILEQRGGIFVIA
jgi:hypothetical protein